MEVSLPLSGALDSPPLRAKTVTGPTANAPSITLPLRFMMVGLISLIVGIVWLIGQPSALATYHYGQNVIALTHLFVLGWISTIVMGAMYQLVPVALETKLYSERLAKWQFGFHVVGFAGMVWMFRVWDMKQVGHFGSVLGFGVLLFVYNIVRTLLRVPRWNVVATAVASALGWISLAILAGLSVASAKMNFDADVEATGFFAQAVSAVAGVVYKFDAIGAMHAHAHLGVVGFFVMLIVGVSYKLIPMFTLGEVQSKRRALLSVLLLNIGLAGSFVCILIRSPLKIAFASVIIVALGVYGWELAAILRARKRGPLDWGIRYFLTAIALLAPLSMLGLVLSWPSLPLTVFTGQMENVYGFMGIIGVISFAIMGMLYKIIPFLVWFGTYSKHIGRAKVPALADMYSTTMQAFGYWAFLAGMVVTIIGTLVSHPVVIQCGSGAIAIAIGTLIANCGRIVAHYFRPRLAPLKSSTATVCE
jgi:hypothetical protein